MKEAFIASVDRVVSEPKTLATAIVDIPWRIGGCQDVRLLVAPLLVDGELPGVELHVLAYPNHDYLKFTISLSVFGHVIWRLCFDQEEGHTNVWREPIDKPEVPRRVEGSHYHPWAKNARFAKRLGHPFALKIAMVLPPELTNFEETLEWFCGQTNIDIPPKITLPPRDSLI